MRFRHPLMSIVLVCSAVILLAGCQNLFRMRQPLPDGPRMALALPGSGPYAPYARKIEAGARRAAEEMRKNGIAMEMEVVDTSDPSWMEKLKALPESFAAVGGPLEKAEYARAKKADALKGRAFFSFQPELEAGDEGALAWRFFPGRQDQIDALVDFAEKRLSIRTFGSLSPGDPTAQHMVNLLEKTLGRRGMRLEKARYSPRNPSSWPAQIGSQLIHPDRTSEGGTPVPHTKFEALFLPGPWKDVPQLTRALAANGENRLVLLGTTLWEPKGITDGERYALAVFPGPWSVERAPRALRAPNDDFWVALGYDFARFAARLGIFERPPAEKLNARLHSLQMIWSMAPLSWDKGGNAHQKLYLFQPAARGMQLLNVDRFLRVRRQVLENGGRSAQAEEAVPAAVPAVAPGGGGAPAALPAVAPGAPGIGTKPLPSYKLRLPSRPAPAAR